MPLNETKTSICNKALALLGEEPINSVEDKTSKAARLCDQHYDLALYSILSDGKWPFATVEAEAQRLQHPDYSKEQKYIYAIPVNCVLISSVYPRDKRKVMTKGVDWDIRYIEELKTNAIICNLQSKTDEDVSNSIYQDEQIMIEYVQANGKSSTYTPNFIRCLVAQLAADLSMPITHDTQRFVAMTQYAAKIKAQALQQALNEDGQDKMHWVDQFTASREGRIL